MPSMSWRASLPGHEVSVRNSGEVRSVRTAVSDPMSLRS